mgnify:CR=1 FL=1
MSHNILIIEDSDDVRENMKEILELSNYHVNTARNGKEGIEVAQKNIPDIILCDVMMPKLDGYGVLRGLSNNPTTKSIPFIFVTAKSDKSDFRIGMDLGADDYLTKPFNGSDLLSLVNARIKKAEVLKELLKNSPDENPWNLMYERDPINVGSQPFSMDKELYNRLQNEGVSYNNEYGSDYMGSSGAGLFDINYVTSYIDPNTGTPLFGNFYEVTLKNRLTGNNLGDFLRDYYGSIELINFNLPKKGVHD